ncbi:alpha/beta hydrolase [Phaeacidiphilus oryzae]|uniref:alpha/beta hydrolase n=1 Tax=Phaeacidiphilus oryzae TaxID=348818 RepID=UPI001F44F1F5|nr:alpha/beta hydrolase [Phaeacidiphilus oryzae]
MPVHPFYQARFAALLEPRGDGRPDDALIEERTREQSRRLAERARSWAPAGVEIRAAETAGPHGPVPLRTYRPAAGAPLGSALVWAHGGGFRAGDLDMPEAHVVCAELAQRAGALVVSVGYRLAVDGVRHPVPVDDVHAVWTALCRGELPAEAGAVDVERLPVALGGASAGAALALATALRGRDGGPRPADALLLAYPFAHFPNPAPDEALAAGMAGLPLRLGPDRVEDMVRGYVGRTTDLPPDALPGAAPLRGLPPTRILVSEYDDLRPSGELLGRQLAECDVPVASLLAEGMVHGHLNNLPDELPEIGKSLEFLAEGLRLAGR